MHWSREETETNEWLTKLAEERWQILGQAFRQTRLFRELRVQIQGRRKTKQVDSNTKSVFSRLPWLISTISTASLPTGRAFKSQIVISPGLNNLVFLSQPSLSAEPRFPEASQGFVPWASSGGSLPFRVGAETVEILRILYGDEICSRRLKACRLHSERMRFTLSPAPSIELIYYVGDESLIYGVCSFSGGVNRARGLARVAARALGQDWKMACDRRDDPVSQQ